jgi:hypothetical protein
MTKSSDRPAAGSGFASWLPSFRRRSIGIQAGERSARLLLLERKASAARVLGASSVDLREQGLITPEETAAHLQEMLHGMGDAPCAVVLPVGRTVSQVMEIRGRFGRAVGQLVQTAGEGASDRLDNVTDAHRLHPFGGYANPAWVTIARESDVEAQIARCGVPLGRVRRVTSPANALINAYASLPEAPRSAALVEIGAGASTLVIVERGQGVFAASFDLGTGAFIEAAALDLECSADEADMVLRRDGALAFKQGSPELMAALARWRGELEKLLEEWARESRRPVEEALNLPRWFSGSALRHAGWRDMIDDAAGGQRAGSWPEVPAEVGSVALAEFAVAYGAALGGVNLAKAPANLLPHRIRRARRTSRQIAGVHLACIVLLACIALLLGNIAQAKRESIRAKEAHLASLEQTRAAEPRALGAIEARRQAYWEAAPVLFMQKRTRDMIAGLRLLQQQRADRPLWFALVADQESYQAAQGAAPRRDSVVFLSEYVSRPGGLVAELSLPADTPDKLAAVSEVVSGLKEGGIFTGVDILPARLRRPLADPAVFAADSIFALNLEVVPFNHSLPDAPPRGRVGRTAVGAGQLFP